MAGTLERWASPTEQSNRYDKIAPRSATCTATELPEYTDAAVWRSHVCRLSATRPLTGSMLNGYTCPHDINRQLLAPGFQKSGTPDAELTPLTGGTKGYMSSSGIYNV